MQATLTYTHVLSSGFLLQQEEFEPTFPLWATHSGSQQRHCQRAETQWGEGRASAESPAVHKALQGGWIGCQHIPRPLLECVWQLCPGPHCSCFPKHSPVLQWPETEVVILHCGKLWQKPTTVCNPAPRTEQRKSLRMRLWCSLCPLRSLAPASTEGCHSPAAPAAAASNSLPWSSCSCPHPAGPSQHSSHPSSHSRARKRQTAAVSLQSSSRSSQALDAVLLGALHPKSIGTWVRTAPSTC